MITISKIIDRVNELILQKYPSHTFYIEDIPEGFERPSFFIEQVVGGTSDVNKTIVGEDVSIQIVYFAPVDDYYLTDAPTRLQVSENIKDIFRKGYIAVEDRAIKVTELTGGSRNNEVYLSVSFGYQETRPADPENYDLMGEINFK
jgi:hypothetical protein